MPEGNGSERDARLQRMEQQQEQFQRDMQNLLTAQIVQNAQIQENTKQIAEQGRNLDKALLREAHFDERVDNLVSAIGDLIRRIPPGNLKDTQ
jgi:hypothetical protein